MTKFDARFVQQGTDNVTHRLNRALSVKIDRDEPIEQNDQLIREKTSVGIGTESIRLKRMFAEDDVHSIHSETLTFVESTVRALVSSLDSDFTSDRRTNPHPVDLR